MPAYNSVYNIIEKHYYFFGSIGSNTRAFSLEEEIENEETSKPLIPSGDPE